MIYEDLLMTMLVIITITHTALGQSPIPNGTGNGGDFCTERNDKTLTFPLSSLNKYFLECP